LVEEVRPLPSVPPPSTPSATLTRARLLALWRLPVLEQGESIWLAVVVPVALVGVSLLLWVAAVREIDLRQMSDLGLASVLPRTAFAALGILAVSFAAALCRRRPLGPVLLLHVVVLVFMVYGVTTLVEDVPRFAVSFRHVGVTEQITRTGHVDPNIDAYFNWPGFFTLLGFVTRAAGLRSAISLADWAPVFFNLLYAGPLFLLLRSATTDRRVVWLGLWLFYLTNWVGQDYLSPQALSYFLYLVVLALLLTFFKRPSAAVVRLPEHRVREIAVWVREPAPPVPREPSKPVDDGAVAARRMWLMFAVVLVFGAMVPSHQLTPFATVAAVLALAASRQSTARGLPTMMIVLLVAWISFMTTAFLAGHIGTVAGGVGQVDENVTANVGNRLHGTQAHVIVVYVRLLLTAAVWALAGLGAYRWYRRGFRDVGFFLLALAPFPLVVLQPYGGEMLLRVYLFALPIMVLFAAAALFVHANREPWQQAAIVTLLSAGLAAAFFVARYGNERRDFFTSNEVTAVEQLYQVAPAGSLLFVASDDLPWKYTRYDQYKYRVLSRLPEWTYLGGERPNVRAAVPAIARVMRGHGHTRGYLILTRSQSANLELYGLARASTMRRLEQALARSPAFRTVYVNRDASVFALRPSQTKRRA
jgi:hypothetical protein